MCFSRTCFLNSAHLLWIILPMCIFLQQTHFFFPLQFSRQSKMSVVWRNFFLVCHSDAEPSQLLLPFYLVPVTLHFTFGFELKCIHKHVSFLRPYLDDVQTLDVTFYWFARLDITPVPKPKNLYLEVFYFS